MKITYSAAASSDGFIAKADGDVSWLDPFHDDSTTAELATIFAEIDGLIMGRKTYDFVFDYGTALRRQTSVGLHEFKLQPLAGANLRVTHSVDEVLDQAEKMNLKHLWLLGGGQLASTFLEKELLTHISITQMPIELGSGIPLFARHQLEDITRHQQKITSQGHLRRIEFTIQHR